MIAVRGITLGAGIVNGFKSVNGVGCIGYLNACAAVDKSPAVSVVIIIVNTGKRSFLGREIECNAFTSPSAEGTLERDADNRYLTVYLNRKRSDVALKSRIALGLKFVFMLTCFGCGKGIARKLLPFAAVNTVIIFINSRISLGGKSYIYICCAPSTLLIFLITAVYSGNGNIGGSSTVYNHAVRTKYRGNIACLIGSSCLYKALEIGVFSRFVFAVVDAPVGAGRLTVFIYKAIFNFVYSRYALIRRINGNFNSLVKESA